MSGAAIVMMLVAMVVIWGGLAFAILHLSRNSPTIDEVHRDL
ncbi:methionine/alanine import family NSS transporter small subunit [Nocardioides donggukensis]|uniref:Methionine/alanine import family NSS transporter small subunit n=1 Tax=Nocardioides donggukensis TaxID=2774019 RepID=A0A927K342_9ACTN|nr:methionine/alanine import family NSS transporter small subunit [Nocardioides donggukensis]MBD8868055.1 methionine/alanine import family NSS transporter small subunit [Nocardioides donggukensis]